MDFDTAFYNFCDAINECYRKHSKKFDHLSYGEDENSFFRPIEVKAGSKNLKLIINRGGSHSVYCFVNKKTGDIYKASSWKAPAKGVRGNIFDVKTYEGFDLAGTSWLYKRY